MNLTNFVGRYFPIIRVADFENKHDHFITDKTLLVFIYIFGVIMILLSFVCLYQIWIALGNVRTTHKLNLALVLFLFMFLFVAGKLCFLYTFCFNFLFVVFFLSYINILFQSAAFICSSSLVVISSVMRRPSTSCLKLRSSFSTPFTPSSFSLGMHLSTPFKNDESTKPTNNYM